MRLQGFTLFLVILVSLTLVSGCDQQVTEAERQNFDKVKLGMTEAEVMQMFPSIPKQSTSPGGFKVLTWGSDSSSISVLFADGRVSTIERSSKSVDIHWDRIIGLACVVVMVLVVIVVAVFLMIRRRRRAREDV